MADKNKDMNRNVNRDTRPNPDANPDAITGAPGSHPVGTGVGAAAGGVGGAVAGAAAGAAIGAATTGPAAPIGGVIGAVVGAVAGGLAGKGIAEQINPTQEDAYWRENYKHRPYVNTARGNYTYEEDYLPAYRYGWEARAQNQDKQWSDVEEDLARDWEQHRGTSKLDWQQAQNACCDAWNRCTPQPPTDARQSDQASRDQAI